MSRGPDFLVYRVDSLTGSTFTEYDVPDKLTFVGGAQARSSDAAAKLYEAEIGSAPALVLREVTVRTSALKAGQPAVPAPGAPDDWKVVELVALVREADAEDVHLTYGKLTEYDQSASAYVTTRDLTEQERLDFGAVIDDAAEED